MRGAQGLRSLRGVISLFQYYRIAAAFLIVMIHQQFWKPCSFVVGLEGAAVPLFACMAGYLFCEDRSDVLTFVRKKVRRILVPYCVWAVIYFVANDVVLDVLVKHEPFGLPGWRSWLLGGTACHLWFLPCLFTIFLVVRVLIRLSYDSLAWFWAEMLLPLAIATQFLPGETSASLSGYVRIYFGRLLFYFALGMVINQLVLGGKMVWCRIIGGALVVVGMANFCCGLVSGLVAGPFAFVSGLLALAAGFQNVPVPKWVDDVAKQSMGIYLVHVLFTSAANVIFAKIGCSTLPSLAALPVLIAIFAMCYVIVRFMPKWSRG